MLRGQILILGGSTPRGLTSGILRFDPAQGHYPRGPAPVPSTATARAGLAAAMASRLARKRPKVTHRG